MTAGTRSGMKGPRKSISVASVERRSTRHSGVSEPQQPAETSRRAAQAGKQLQSGGTCPHHGRAKEQKLQASEAPATYAVTVGSKRKAQHMQKPAATAKPARLGRQSQKLQQQDGAAKAAKAAAPRQVAVLGRTRTTGRRPTGSVVWDGETYSVCSRLVPSLLFVLYAPSRRLPANIDTGCMVKATVS